MNCSVTWILLDPLINRDHHYTLDDWTLRFRQAYIFDRHIYRHHTLITRNIHFYMILSKIGNIFFNFVIWKLFSSFSENIKYFFYICNTIFFYIFARAADEGLNPETYCATLFIFSQFFIKQFFLASFCIFCTKHIFDTSTTLGLHPHVNAYLLNQVSTI